MKAGEMPPGEKKVPADQIAVIEKWIAAGRAPRSATNPARSATRFGHHRRRTSVLVLPAAETASGAGCREREAADPQPDRLVCVRETPREGVGLQPGGRPAQHARPPRDVRPPPGLPPTCRPRSTRPSRTNRPTPMKSCSTGCSRRRPTANGGGATGSTQRVTPTATATATPTPSGPARVGAPPRLRRPRG